MRFESPRPEKNSRKTEQIDPYLLKLWREFGFYGNPPQSGSIAEGRLKDACNSYTTHVLDHHLLRSGDTRRRELHNEISMLTLAKRHEELDYLARERVTDFACLYARGMTLAEAEEQNHPAASD